MKLGHARVMTQVIGQGQFALSRVRCLCHHQSNEINLSLLVSDMKVSVEVYNYLNDLNV